ncbi:MAG: tRNA guanosine(34) transglycosylase Tgt [Planctomycetota bacterium]|nr:tRNA guanosine(34) transglycosylase Tgt [Planctomycetota bacterium]
MAQSLHFSISHSCTESNARVGRVETLHGGFDTPAFMPVGTRGTIKGLTPAQIHETGSQIVLNNAYHLMLRPGDDLIARRGGVQKFMGWDGPILTDSGGYQAYSMSDINSIDESGVTFKSIIDGSMIHLSPERSIEVQNNLGADIIMAFDDCPPSVEPETLNESRKRMGTKTGATTGDQHRDRLQTAHDRTICWLERCVQAHGRPDEQALFGIVQGGPDLDLRKASVEAICNIELPGYAIGGVAVGEGPEIIRQVVEFTAPLMPEAKPRYLMGVGYERDIVDAVRAGVDMFDCVLPTRNGRNANAFTKSGPKRLRNARYGEDDAPIEADCDCYACSKGFSRAYLRHLFMSKEMLGPILVSLHNIRHFQRLLLDIRRAIREDAWSFLFRTWPVLDAPAPRDDEAEIQDEVTPGSPGMGMTGKGRG